MFVEKIRYPNDQISWTATSKSGETISDVRNWVIHLEQINLSPNTIKSYVRHIVKLGNYLQSKSKSFSEITMTEYDHFLNFLTYSDASPNPSSNVLLFKPPSRPNVYVESLFGQDRWES